MSTLPDQFFTVASFATLAGAALITAVVTSALYKSFGWAPTRTGIAVALLVVAAGLFLSDEIRDPKADVVGFFNAFLVFLTAAGMSDLLSPKTRGGLAEGERPFWRSWFH